MSALLVLLTFSGLLGLTSFGVGMLPLSFTFSGELRRNLGAAQD
jgi:hypothetical protein